MRRASTDFTVRCDEVERYLKFVIDLEQKPNALDGLVDPAERSELLKTLKATGYLLMYNLVESTAKNVFEGLFDTLRQEGVKFDDCHDDLQKQMLKLWRKLKPENLVPVTDLASQIIHHAFNNPKIFSGNVDGKALKKTSSSFGVENPISGDIALLLTVKNKRNDLAHGVMSFSDIGRDTSATDLQDAFIQIKSTFQQTLANFGTHISDRKYLRSP